MMMRSRPQKASRVGPGVTAAQGALRVADHAADGSAGGPGETGGPAGARAETAEHPSGRTPAALGAIAVPPTARLPAPGTVVARRGGSGAVPGAACEDACGR